jgi:cyclin T
MAANPGPSHADSDLTANRWIFTPEQLANTPSRKCGIDSEKESNYRQQAASLIQDMGQKLQV